MKRWIPLALAAITAGFIITALPAGSHQNPGGCLGNNPGLNVSRDKTLVRNGDVLTYRVEVANQSTATSSACDITGATVSLTLPAPDGTPTGQKVVLKTGLDLPAEMALTSFDPVPYTVAVNPGVVDAVVKAEVAGALHDTALIDHAASVTKTLGTDVTTPLTTPAVTSSVTNGEVPLSVTYTYTEKNAGDAPIEEVKVTDDLCTPVVYASGDTNSNSVLDMGETWTFTCSRTFNEPGTFTNRVVITGKDARDKRPVPDELTSVSVTVSAPPAPPPPAPPTVMGEETKPPAQLPRTL